LEADFKNRNGRLRELDFLRGIAILLVLLRHKFLFQFTVNMGWIGVDLFFVLSGFLVSGLLFKEFIKYGRIAPGRFLIRRGFKIYPIYYLSYPLYLLSTRESYSVSGILGDLFFVQNYFTGWGYAYDASWSLAIEEHFYFLFTFLFWLALKRKWIHFKTSSEIKPNDKFISSAVLIMAFCLVLRIISNILYTKHFIQNFTMTHLRMDSLLAGVLVGYLFYFRKPFLEFFYRKNRHLLLPVAALGIAWTPFIGPLHSFVVKTIGFSLLYMSFSIVLIHFLLVGNINRVLDSVLSRPVVTIISKIGYCSYSIYIIHTFILMHNIVFFDFLGVNYNQYLDFALVMLMSVLAGFLMTFLIEANFLKLRDKIFPSRTQFGVIR
jgi:peptidoglycan/LPS O-acetylase OafA/YrhL